MTALGGFPLLDPTHGRRRSTSAVLCEIVRYVEFQHDAGPVACICGTHDEAVYLDGQRPPRRETVEFLARAATMAIYAEARDAADARKKTNA